MTTDPAATDVLLRRSHHGDRAALDALLAANLDWVCKRVHDRLGPLLRAKGETQDYVQDVVVDVLRSGPRFVTADQAQFRALLCRIVENVLSDRWHGLHAQRRAVTRERPLPSDTVLGLDAPSAGTTRPGEAAARAEDAEWIHLAMELLPAADREILWLREWTGQTFPAIATGLGITEDAARMRYQRALPRLAERLELLRAGRLAEALAAADRA
ncbi:MAG TPA: sigma-70 family RNA polymerase sigma factor [Planctomycetota bacterium]|nr:sigma-70 family RNA polymerase sigma factor [Planctomycetota bacterium]